MNVAIWLSSRGGSPLQSGLERGIRQLGHRVEEFHHSKDYDLVLMFNQCAHTTDYQYPQFPRQSAIAFIDTAEYGYFRRLPGVANRYWNTFTEDALNHDTKNRSEQLKLKQFLLGKSFPYFMREFHKSVEFPTGYYPIDYPLYHYSVCHHPPNREQYLRRDLDLFVSWGASHPWRLNITKALRDCHTRCEIFVLEQDGAVRIPQDRYFARTIAAKCGVSFDGYGSGSFRMTEVLVRGLLLQGPLSIKLPVEFTDGLHWREYHIESSGEEFLSTDIQAALKSALSDPEGSYRIYEAGYHHVMQHYTEKAMAAYVLKVVENHKWGAPTKIV
jgi:hypothetical protein